MKKDFMKKILIIGIIFLLVGVNMYPTVAEKSISLETISTNDESYVKEYLFQTIIDLVNHPCIQQLLEHSKADMRALFYCDVHNNQILNKISFKNYDFLYTMLCTKPSFSQKYLTKLCDQGVALVSSIGEDEALKMLEFMQVNDQNLFNEFTYVIKHDAVLSHRFDTLAKMNDMIPNTLQTWPFPIVCTILFLNYFTLAIYRMFFETIGNIFGFIPIIHNFVQIMWSLLTPFIYLFYNLGVTFECYWTHP